MNTTVFTAQFAANESAWDDVTVGLWQRINQRPVNDRQRAIINLLLGDFHGHLTTSKYAKLAKCSTDSALRDIRDLLARGVIVRNPGGGRSTSYRLAAAEPPAGGQT